MRGKQLSLGSKWLQRMSRCVEAEDCLLVCEPLAFRPRRPTRQRSLMRRLGRLATHVAEDGHLAIRDIDMPQRSLANRRVERGRQVRAMTAERIERTSV